MNRIRNTCLCALTGLAVFCTAACTRGPAQAFEPTEDSLYITGSGQVTSAAIETYEKDYYTEEGLKAFVEENLAAFNQDAASLAGDGEKAVSYTHLDVYKRQQWWRRPGPANTCRSMKTTGEPLFLTPRISV